MYVVMVCIGEFGVCGISVFFVFGDVENFSFGVFEKKMGWYV